MYLNKSPKVKIMRYFSAYQPSHCRLVTYVNDSCSIETLYNKGVGFVNI